MAESYKRLGSITANGTIGTGQTLYGPVPASTSAVVSSIIICNQAATSATYRLAYSAGTTYASTNDYIIFGATIAANDSVILTIGATLATTTYLLFSASAATVSAIAFGTEIT
jgi:hypothetical protein